MDETSGCTPREACERLGVASSTLRTYAQHFERLLSPYARGGVRSDHGFSHRRYGPADLWILEKVKRLLDAGLSYEAVFRELAGEGELVALPARRRTGARAPAPRAKPDCAATPSPEPPPDRPATHPALPDLAGVVEGAVRDGLNRTLRELDSAAAAELAALGARVAAVEGQLVEQRHLANELIDEVHRLRRELEAVGQVQPSSEEPLPERRTWIGRIIRRE